VCCMVAAELRPVEVLVHAMRLCQLQPASSKACSVLLSALRHITSPQGHVYQFFVKCLSATDGVTELAETEVGVCAVALECVVAHEVRRVFVYVPILDCACFL
jgi:hypothetical protein